MLPVAPPSLDYVPGLEEPHTPPAPHDVDEHEPMFIQPHDPNFVPEPIYPEYIPLKDEHVLPAEKQPLPPVVSPTAESPEYVAESDIEEDPEQYEDDETEDGSVDYPMDRGDNGDDDDGDSSGDDADDEDEDEDEEDEEEEEEHLALADSAIVIPTDELVSPPKGTEPVMPPPSTDTTTTEARIAVRLQAAISFPPEAETEMPPRKRLCLSTLGSREVGYGIRDTWVDPTETVLEIAPMTVGEVNTRVIELDELHEHDTQDLHALLEDAQDSTTRISQRVAVDSQRMQQTEIAELRETNRRRQTQMVKTLRVMRDMRQEMGDMQAELLALREEPRRARQPGGDARPLRRVIRRRITRSGWTTGNAGGSIPISCSRVSGPTSTGLCVGTEELEQAPPSLVYIRYVLEPVYPEYIPPEDDVFPAEEQPL
nr:hypothetical protein [Tanacetum cinerariifolium]